MLLIQLTLSLPFSFLSFNFLHVGRCSMKNYGSSHTIYVLFTRNNLLESHLLVVNVWFCVYSCNIYSLSFCAPSFGIWDWKICFSAIDQHGKFWDFGVRNLMSMLNGLKKEMCGMLGDMEILIWEKCMFRYPVKNYLKHIRNLILVFILFLFNRCTLVHVSQLNNFNCKLNIHIRLRKMGSLTYALI